MRREGMRSIWIWLLGVGLFAAPAMAQNPPRPNALEQPIKDGCQRNPAGLLTFSSPEWVYVYGDDTTRVLEGTANFTSPAGEDLPQNHESYDLNSNVLPDPGYEYLLGGDPVAGNGNFGGPEGAEDKARLHVEWETGVVPFEIWPTENDRIKLWGPWVWDCGHWGEGVSDPDYFLPGQGPSQIAPLRGEATEIHPWEAVVITRKASAATGVDETEAGVLISSEGTGAYAESACTKQFPAPQTGVGITAPMSPAWTACVSSVRHQIVNDRPYTFSVSAPPKPSPRARLRYRTEQILPGKGNPAEEIVPRDDRIDVTVRFGDQSPTADMQYSKRFFVGWEGGTATATHLLVALQDIHVIRSLDPNPNNTQQTGVPPAEWLVYVDVNGVWDNLSAIQPRLLSVNDGETLPLPRTLDVYVPPGAPVRVLFNPRECDLPRIEPCGDPAEVAGGNDHPGDIVQTFASADAALGSHLVTAKSGDYEVRYAIRPGPPPSTGSAGPVSGPCFDTRAPRTRIAPRRLRVGRRGVRARGSARDVGCGPVRGRVRRTEIAVFRRARGRCRFLTRRGRLSGGRACRRPIYLRARGTRRWRFRRRRPLPRGRYVIRARSIDRAGNVELVRTRANTRRARVR